MASYDPELIRQKLDAVLKAGKPLHELIEKYARGDQVKKSQLVEAPRICPTVAWPPNVTKLICGFLEGSIKSPRGRHAASKEEQLQEIASMTSIYRETLSRLRQLKKTHGSLLGHVPAKLEGREAASMPINEIAAALTAKQFAHRNITGRTVQNLVSKARIGKPN
jgi:hypothetical protein